ncbi:MAG: hypothetical protein Ct9H300mP16_14950 [Pseudomonadota bacterium]|nr:MAG: hypothetical protein Ct9H300mP16_14950 [Pseudomonadota bacterium]
MIHRGQSIDRQAELVSRVKRSHSPVIENPLCLSVSATIGQARSFASRHNIKGILIETRSGRGILAGVLTRRDIPWQKEADARPVSDFMTTFERLKTAPPDVSTDDAERIMFEGRFERLPLIDGERRIHGLITRKDVRFLRERPYARKGNKGRLLAAAAVGCTGDYLERADQLVRSGSDCFFIDIAHGHSQVMETAVGRLKSEFSDIPLICGNVATGPWRPVYARHRSRCGQGRGGAGAGLPYPSGNGRRRAAASGDPGNLVRCGGRDHDHGRRGETATTRIFSWPWLAVPTP